MGKKFPTRVLITGATGFLGRNVAEKLTRDSQYSVTGVWNERPPYKLENLEWLQGDLTRKEEVERIVPGFDTIIQMAATTSGVRDIIQRPHVHVVDNVVMNSLLFRAAFDHDVSQFIFPSCSIVYSSRSEPHDEDSIDLNEDIKGNYFAGAWNKLYLEKMCRFYATLGRTKFSVIRHSNIYGPYDKYDLDKSHVFGATITKVMQATDKIVVWGDGSEGRDFLHVDDLVNLIIRMMESQKPQFELICAGAGYAISIRDLAQRIVQNSAKDIKIEFDTSKPTIPTTISLSFAKALKEYNWSPTISINEGIHNTVEWWKKNLGKKPENSDL